MLNIWMRLLLHKDKCRTYNFVCANYLDTTKSVAIIQFGMYPFKHVIQQTIITSLLALL